jgi:hypothetical protein
MRAAIGDLPATLKTIFERDVVKTESEKDEDGSKEAGVIVPPHYSIHTPRVQTIVLLDDIFAEEEGSSLSRPT